MAVDSSGMQVRVDAYYIEHFPASEGLDGYSTRYAKNVKSFIACPN
jgi:hypothetical protein